MDHGEPILSKFFPLNTVQADLDQAHLRLLRRRRGRVAGRTQTPSESLAIAAWCSAFEFDGILRGPLQALHVRADTLFRAEAASLSRMMSRADSVTVLGLHRDMRRLDAVVVALEDVAATTGFEESYNVGE
jgi:hypothetical protein